MADTNEIIGIIDDTSDMTGTLDGDLIRGYSAYEIYLENGGTLSEEEWLESLNGFSPSASVEQTDTGATVTVTDESGETTAEILNGTDGHSPVITAERTGFKQTTVYVDNVQIAQILDGYDGDDGISPVANVEKSGTTTTITITDKTGTTTATVTDGTDGYTPVRGTDYWTAQDKAGIVDDVLESQEISDLKETLSQKYSKPATGIPASDLASGVIPDVPVTDVQVNGTSVLDAQGVAEIPLADATNAGVVKVTNASYGISMRSSGDIQVEPSTEGLTKSGTEPRRPIVPIRQHISTFYGLAKAAGDTTQSASSNAVGAYTDAAKVVIQKMLGIYEAPWELIREDTFTNETEADHSITVDGNGEAFELTDAIILFETPKQSTASSKKNYGAIGYYNNSERIATVYCNAWTQDANATAHGLMSMVETKGGLVFITARASGLSTNMGGLSMAYQEGLRNTILNGVQDREFIITKISIDSVTGTGHYKLYGKRKWS